MCYVYYIAGLSNGRTSPFGGEYLGPSPSPAAIYKEFMNQIDQSESDLQKHLTEQVSFLKVSADSYDKGFEAEAKRMAVSIRVLLHDTSHSTSLLTQLGTKDVVRFYDSAVFPQEFSEVFDGASLVAIPGTADAKAIAFLDEGPTGTSGFVNFSEYWNKQILSTSEKNFTRSELVLFVANTDGGAHVDPTLDVAYANLSRNHSFGWKVGTSEMTTRSVDIVELASIRQIAHEIIRTFDPNYPHKGIRRDEISGMFFPRVFHQISEKRE